VLVVRYPREIVEEVRLQNDIVEVISQYVPLKKKGGTYFGLCPFHNEKTPSFSVNSEKQFYYCFGCGAAGNVFGFVMEMENCDFPEALKKLADRMHIALPEPEKSGQALATEQLKARLFEIHSVAGRFYHEVLQSDEGHYCPQLYGRKKASTQYQPQIWLRLCARTKRCLNGAFEGKGIFHSGYAAKRFGYRK